MELTQAEIQELARRANSDPVLKKQIEDAHAQFQAQPVQAQQPKGLGQGLSQGIGQGIGAFFKNAPSVILEDKLPTEQKISPLEMLMYRDMLSKQDPSNRLADERARNLLAGTTTNGGTVQTGSNGQSETSLGGQVITGSPVEPIKGYKSVSSGKITDEQGNEIAPFIQVQTGWETDELGRKSPKFEVKENKLYEEAYKKQNPSPTEQKAKKEMEDAEKFTVAAYEASIKGTQSSLDLIEKVKKGIKNFGMLGNIALPGTTKGDWKNDLEALLAKRVLDVMKEMKEQSKTGATGMGALSEKELAVLQFAATSLRATTTPERANEILQNMEKELNDVLLKKQTFLASQGKGGQKVEATQAPGNVSIATDANGNRAEVELNPDGSIKRVLREL